MACCCHGIEYWYWWRVLFLCNKSKWLGCKSIVGYRPMYREEFMKSYIESKCLCVHRTWNVNVCVVSTLLINMSRLSYEYENWKYTGSVRIDGA